MKIEDLARACHEINKIYCESIGDFSHPHWEDAPEWQKESHINAVESHFLYGSEIPPNKLHDLWLYDKLKSGWKYGIEKNTELKTHPNLLPYENLKKEDKFKDVLSAKIISTLFPFIDAKIKSEFSYKKMEQQIYGK